MFAKHGLAVVCAQRQHTGSADIVGDKLEPSETGIYKIVRHYVVSR